MDRGILKISIIVYSSLITEFVPQRGVRQGDPLIPFLFTIVAQCLSGLMREVVEKGLYKGHVVGCGRINVDLLQYANDTILYGEASLVNVMTIKSIMRCFELVSGLMVNFAKISCGNLGVEY